MSRRRTLLVPLLVAALVLTACGGDDDNAATDDPSDGRSESAGGNDGERTVEHAMGATSVPAEPERIVVLDSSFLDAALALDVAPVGATEASAGAGMPAYLADRVPDIEVVGLTEEPNLEAVAALDPDLILGAKVRHEAMYDDLSRIAPTVFSESSGTNWKDGLAVTAEALGATAEAQDFLDDYETRAAELGELVGADETHLSMVRFLLPDQIRIYGPETFSGTVLTDVGFDLGDHDWDEYSMSVISTEQLDQADADLLFATSYGGSGEPEADATFDAVRPIWKSLSAVAEGRQYWVEDDIWMLGIGPIGAGLILDDVESLLA